MTITRLAVDLDGVLTEPPVRLAHAANETWGLDLPDHAFVDSAGLNVPQHVREWVYFEGGPASSLEPAPWAQEFLTQVLDTFGPDQVQIITARPSCVEAATLEWLCRNGFPEIRVLFAEDKVPVALQAGVTHAIEDSMRHGADYAKHGIRCCLISPHPGQPQDSNRLVRVRDLRGAFDRLTGRNSIPEKGSGNKTDFDAIGSRKWSTEMNTGDPATSSKRYRIVVSDVIDDRARELMSSQAELIDVDGTDTEQLTRALSDADALIVRSETQVTREILAAGPNLQLVARAGVGVDNIDVNAATEAGVLVLNAPGANAISAGEHTLGLLLALSRSIPDANEAVHAGRWERKRFKPFDINGKTIGIVGLGRVGSVLAQRLRGFDVELIAHDPYISNDRFREMHCEPVGFEELLQRADVISFHVPATAETTNMLDADSLQAVKQGAIVLNCARGEIVDADALADALKSGQLAGAGVDVFPSEPAHESPLFDLPNVVLTPHIGGSSGEALAKVGEMIGSTVLAALAGQAVPNAVNLPPATMNATELQRLTHVAAAAGHLLAVLRSDRPNDYRVTVNGVVPREVVEHVAAAGLAQSLERWTDRRVTPVNARLIADELNMEIQTFVADADPDHVPEFTFEVNGDDPHRVTVRWDRRDAGIMEVDRFTLERPLSGDVLITHHIDRPGIVGRIGTLLGNHGINIAGMQVGRHQPRGEAIMVLNVDEPIPEYTMQEIKVMADVHDAYVVSLPPSLPGPDSGADSEELFSTAAD
ncbi:MAG: phosphoglycerate dehydrogenase [Sphaerobacteraceae bacterium]|nr:MAG: phosphoglycerate dehydrogenase [Sphaerobacteraceae bacterium]